MGKSFVNVRALRKASFTCLTKNLGFRKMLTWNLLNLLIQPVKNVDTMSNGETSRKFPGPKDTPTDTSNSADVHFSRIISASNVTTDDSQ